MKIIYFGIFIPLFFIIIVAFLAATNLGINEKIIIPAELNLSELSPENCTYNSGEETIILTREVTNSLFLSKNIEKNSQKFSFCLQTPDRTFSASVIEDKLNAEETSASYGLRNYRFYELGPGESAVIESKLRHCSINKDYLHGSYPTNILVIENEEDNYNSYCYSLTDEEIESAEKIILVS